MWDARTKRDLVIEVWEKLDCDKVGSAEIEAIETAVAARFGESAVDSPMAIARIVADEGAELRHSEIMALFVRRRSAIAYEPSLADVAQLRDLPGVRAALRDLTQLRGKYIREQDKKSATELKKFVIGCKTAVMAEMERSQARGITRYELAEIVQWYTVWLQTPEIFDDWVALRSSTADFREKFADQFPPLNNA